MKKYLIMLAVFVVWCIVLPAAANFAKAPAPSFGDSDNSEKTQESFFEHSNIDIYEQNNSSSQSSFASPETSGEEPESSGGDVETSEENSRTASETTSETSKEESSPPAISLDANKSLHYINVYNHKTGKIMRLELEEYVVGVVYAEVPSSFDMETLKAQAIAIRSYVMNNYMSKQRSGGHPGAELCTSAAHCMAYFTKADMAARYGDEFAEKSYATMKKAVDATKGIVMTYGGKPANTVFHASSSGFTEDCVEVWGNNLPYLVSVTTPDESGFYGFYGKTNYSASQLRAKLSLPASSLSSEPSTWVTDFVKNSSGRCVSAKIGGKSFTGDEIRKKLGLKSTHFKITVTTEGLCFDTEGYGHGVGMSQYGADIMAKQGSDMRQILNHYYTGVKLETIKDEWFQ